MVILKWQMFFFSFAGISKKTTVILDYLTNIQKSASNTERKEHNSRAETLDNYE